MKRNIRAAGLILGIVALAGVAVGQSNPSAEIRGERTPSFDANQIVFKPGAGRVGLALSVSGPDGYRYQKDYEPGVHPTFSVRDLDDGLYSFELRIVAALKTNDTGSAGTKRSGVSQNERGLKKVPGQSQDAIVESGHFRVEAGNLVLRNVVERGAEEPPSDLELTGQTDLPDKDVCYADDLIVDGSLCVGYDCVCGTGFSFDTIILKENNLRIFFDDTSTTASFPRNKWRIVINDSTNGGASYFGIDDVTAGWRTFAIEAGARQNSLYVDDQGDVGLGTSTPVVNLHIRDGNTPTLRLEQDGSSGFAPQTWDVAGNETNFFIRDTTSGSTLPFRIRPGAPTSSIDIATGGDVGFGTSSPNSSLHVKRTGGSAALELEYNNSWIIRSQANDQLQIRDNTGTKIPMRFGAGANTNLLLVGVEPDGSTAVANEVNITGNLVVSGTITPDFVFDPDYPLESIEEHAEYMWKNGHLPAVGEATADGFGTHEINLGRRSQSMLEELEKAHLYIEQLNARIKALEALLAKVDAPSTGD